MGRTRTSLGIAALILGAAPFATACRVEGARPDPDPTHCLAKVETEECQDDDLGQNRRMQCNDVGIWTPIETCASPDVCQEGFSGDGKRWTLCTAVAVGKPGAGGSTSASDAGTVGDAGKATDAGTVGDAGKLTDAGASPASDAGSAQAPNEACLQAHCPVQAQACLTDLGCASKYAALLACMQACASGCQACFASCGWKAAGDGRATNLVQCGLFSCICGAQAGCGDGKCASPETSATCPKDCQNQFSGTCAGHCGAKSTDCYCDPACAQTGDCCPDYQTQCP